MQSYPEWIYILSWAYLLLSFLCGLLIVADEFMRPQKLAIMNLVWPITALYWGLLGLWGYLKIGRKMTRQQQRQTQVPHQVQSGRQGGSVGPRESAEATRKQVAVADTHCGAGCTLGDIAAELWVSTAGITIAGSVFSTRIVTDFLLAWLFGVIFQYFTIAPLRGLSLGEGIIAAIRADTFAIVAFEIGLFGWMALLSFA